MEKQVNKNNYNFKKYCDQDRWASYWHQLDEILRLKPNNVLEIGVGDRVVGNYIKNNTDIDYKCFDIAADLKPDIIGSINNLEISDNFFDIVCAFEVLEHLLFEAFKQALGELKRVSRDKVIISLPHWGRHFSFYIRLPFIKRLGWQIKFSLFPLKHKFKGEHYWEIGKRDYPSKLIKKEIERIGFNIVKDYIAFSSPYHHFFILKK